MPLWFRAYNETIDDRKLIHLARKVGVSQAAVLGAWWILLTLANNNTDRGFCVVDQETKLSKADLIAELLRAGIQPAADLFDKFLSHGLVEWNDEHKAYWIPQFMERQYISDSSTDRVREWRARKKQQEEQEGNDDETPDETLQERSGNGPETETETETEAETEAETDTMHDAAGSGDDLISLLTEHGADNPEAMADSWPWGLDETRRYFRMFAYGDPAVKGIENPIGYAISLQRKGAGPPKPQADDPDDRRRYISEGVEY